jgi:uncharacterized protein DUF6907
MTTDPGMTVAVLAARFACPDWCDGTCGDDPTEEWRRMHTQADVKVPARKQAYGDDSTPTNVLLGLIRCDEDVRPGCPEISLGFEGGWEDVRLTTDRARELAARLVELADLGDQR